MSNRRGLGHVFRPTYKCKRTGKTKTQKVWWITYSRNGKRFKERGGTHTEAKDLLKRRLGEKTTGPSARDLEKVLFEDLAELIRADYKKHGRKSIVTLGGRINHLSDAFAGWRVVDIQEAAIDRYATDRLAEGTPAGTVNRELSALLRMFNLGRRAKLVDRVPVIDKLKERNVRKGFAERGDVNAILDELQPAVRPIALVGFITGWRKGELISRKWHHVDFEAGFLRLEPGETKNDEGRQFPLIPELRAVLEEQYERKRAVEQATGRIIDSVFFREDGRPVIDFRGAWEGACKRAGQEGLLFHDLRRSAVRNLVRAGVPEPVAMKLTGHRTRSVFLRYAIIDEQMLKDGAARLAEFLDASKDEERKALAL